MKNVHITLMGKATLPVAYPIIKNGPEVVYIICSKESKAYGQCIKDVLGKNMVINIITIADAFDIKKVKVACDRIHEIEGDEAKFLYNITGGNKPMSIGAQLAANEHGAEIIYTNSDELINIRTFEKEPFICNIPSKTIFALQGQKLKSYEVYKHDDELLECARQIMYFCNKNVGIFSALISEYRQRTQLPSYYYNDKRKFSYSKKGNNILVERYGETLLDITHPRVHSLLLEGRWWEALVAEKVALWADGKYEVWHNVEFQPVADNSEDQVKNEIDILVNTGNKFIFIECKSGSVIQDNIYKLAAVRRTYGGVKSKSVLALFRSNVMKPNNRDKAKDRSIEIIEPSLRRDALERIPDEMERIKNMLTIE